MQHYGIVNIANSILNSIELDETVAQLMVSPGMMAMPGVTKIARPHVEHALKVKWDTSRSMLHGVDTHSSYTAAKAKYDQLQIPIMELMDNALSHDDFVNRLKEIFSEVEENQAETKALNRSYN